MIYLEFVRILLDVEEVLMKIAVLMSTYNGEDYIREQIESVFSQIGDFDLDLWVRDDGSKDSTQRILQEYSEQGKLYWYTGQNLGPAKSFLDLLYNCGYEGYDYFAFADQDDYWLTDKIQSAITMLGIMDRPKLYFANAELVDSKLSSFGRPVYRNIPKFDFHTLVCAGGILGCTTVFNKKLAECIVKKPLPKKMIMHDYYVSVLCLALGGEIFYDKRAHMKYRQHQNNVVGVSCGIINTIRSRLSDINQRAEVSISEQSAEILALYEDEIYSDYSQWLKKVSSYREKTINRILLAITQKTRYINGNMGLKFRLSILMGNR